MPNRGSLLRLDVLCGLGRDSQPLFAHWVFLTNSPTGELILHLPHDQLTWDVALTLSRNLTCFVVGGQINVQCISDQLAHGSHPGISSKKQSLL